MILTKCLKSFYYLSMMTRKFCHCRKLVKSSNHFSSTSPDIENWIFFGKDIGVEKWEYYWLT